MRNGLCFFAFVVAVVSSSLFADSSKCMQMIIEPEKVEIAALLPTQTTYGKFEFEIREEKIEAARKKNKLAEFKIKRVADVVLAPSGELFLLDGHHDARALIASGEKRMWARVNWELASLRTTEAFRSEMERRGWVYLKGIRGTAITWDQLPKSVLDLKDDAYRSLAWLIRKAGGFDKDTLHPYQELEWANWLRTQIDLPENVTPQVWHWALAEGLRLAVSPTARSLRGWHGNAERYIELLTGFILSEKVGISL